MRVLWIVCFIFISIGLADTLKIAVGAGYKKPVQEVIKLYEAKHETVDAVYGNMAQIFAHAKQAEIALVIADKKFLKKQQALTFEAYQTIGLGRAVIAYAKDVPFEKWEDLKDARIKSIAMPEVKKAIYGDAGMEFLEKSQLYDAIKSKLLIVATVPQVSAYVSTKEVDAGIMNLTAALDSKEKLGGYIEIPQTYYTPIEIVAGSLSSCKTDNQCQTFLQFLTSPEAKAVFTKYGL